MNFTPVLLRCENRGLLLEYRRGRVWSDVVCRDAAHVYTKKIRSAELDLCYREVYEPGVGAAAERFLNPTCGVATVTPQARLILEEIMKTYLVNTSTNKLVGSFATEADAGAVKGENPAVVAITSAEDAGEKLTAVQMAGVVSEISGKAVGRFRDKGKGADAVWNALEGAVPPPIATATKTTGGTAVYAIVEGADITSRRGGMRRTLDALAARATATVAQLYDDINPEGTEVVYKQIDIRADLSRAMTINLVKRVS